MALDNSALPPVFMPTGRNQDGVFGSLMFVVDQTAYSGHVPVGVLHVPNGRRYGPAEAQSTGNASTAQVVRILIDALGRQIEGVGVDSRLSQLALAFLDIAALDRYDMEVVIRDSLRSGWQADLQAAEATRSAIAGKNAAWDRDLNAYQAALRMRIASPRDYLPNQWTVEGRLNHAETQRYFRRFGRLLSAWPSLWAAAARQRSGT
jgi:hypothetical protein